VTRVIAILPLFVLSMFAHGVHLIGLGVHRLGDGIECVARRLAWYSLVLLDHVEDR